MQEFDYTYDEDRAERVVALLDALDVPAVVDQFEPAMFQVRLDPADRATNGWVAIAGPVAGFGLGWFVIETTLDPDDLAYVVASGDNLTAATVVSLGEPVTAEPAQVTIALMGLLAQRP